MFSIQDERTSFHAAGASVLKQSFRSLLGKQQVVSVILKDMPVCKDVMASTCTFLPLLLGTYVPVQAGLYAVESLDAELPYGLCANHMLFQHLKRLWISTSRVNG